MHNQKKKINIEDVWQVVQEHIYKYKNHNCLQNRWKLEQKTNTKKQKCDKNKRIHKHKNQHKQQKFKQMNKQTMCDKNKAQTNSQT